MKYSATVRQQVESYFNWRNVNLQSIKSRHIRLPRIQEKKYSRLRLIEVLFISGHFSLPYAKVYFTTIIVPNTMD